MSSAKAYIVGAGPGDPGLLTLAGLSAIRSADVVLYDRLVSDEVLAFVSSSAEKIYVGKLEGEQNKGQSRIFQKLIKAVNEGKTVLRLKGGEPLVFGRGAEEWQFLKNLGCEVQYIPGISSSIAVPGLAGIPVTCRELSSSFAVVTAKLKGGESPDWSAYRAIETLVVLMGVKDRADMAKELIIAGRDRYEPVAFIENGSLGNERVTVSSLQEVADERTDIEAPAVIVVGKVALMHMELKELNSLARLATNDRAIFQ